MMIFRDILFTIAFLLACPSLSAGPANRSPITMSQPDGTTFLARLSGDEFSRTLTTMDGCALAKGQDGYYYYAYYESDGKRHPSAFRADRKAPASVLSQSRVIPPVTESPRRTVVLEAASREAELSKVRLRATGVVRKSCLVIPSEFQDEAFTYGRDYLDKMIDRVKNYLDDQFAGKYEFSFTISRTVTLSHTSKYYGADGESDSNLDVKVHEAIIEACKALDAEVDFSEFDADGDGKIDNVLMIVPGKDQAECGDEDRIWSHQYYIKGGAGIILSLDGKDLDSYAISTELSKRDDGTYGFTSIGRICHEYSHSLGLVDFYDTDKGASGGWGNGLFYTTSLMDGGSYNDQGNTPPNYNAIEREILNIGEPEALKVGSYTLEPVSVNGRYLKMETDVSGEYWLFECRAAKGWDAAIGGSGLAIYHIDKSDNAAGRSDRKNRNLSANERWLFNEVNCNPEYQCAEFVSADPSVSAFDSKGNYTGSPRKIFFPYNGATSFTSFTNPAFIFNDKETESPMVITDIRKSGDNITFTVRKKSDEALPDVVFGKADIFQDAMILSWESNDADYEGRATVLWGKPGEDADTLEVEPFGKGGYSLTLEGLTPRTAYTVDIFFRSGDITGTKVSNNYTTNSLYDNGFPYIYLNSVNRNQDGSFPSGTALPLKLFNAIDAAKIEWQYSGKSVTVDGSGYYHPSSSGELKAVVTWKDGTVDTVIKYISIK